MPEKISALLGTGPVNAATLTRSSPPFLIAFYEAR